MTFGKFLPDFYSKVNAVCKLDEDASGVAKGVGARAPEHRPWGRISTLFVAI